MDEGIGKLTRVDAVPSCMQDGIDACAQLMKNDDLSMSLMSLRRKLEGAFRPDTAAQGFPGTAASTGHCAAVATIVFELLGGQLISTIVRGHSHWLNRILAEGELVDVDLTGDQFGGPPIAIAVAGRLYADARVRDPEELTEETISRARILAQRAGLPDVGRAIRKDVNGRPVDRSELCGE